MIRISLSQRLSALQKHSPLLTTWPHSSLSYQHKRQKIKVIKDTLSLTIHSALSLRKPIRKTSLTLTNHTHTKKPFSSSLSPLNSQLTHSSKFPLIPSTQIRRSINKTLASLKFHSSSPKSSRRHTQPTNRNPPSRLHLHLHSTSNHHKNPSENPQLPLPSFRFTINQLHHLTVTNPRLSLTLKKTYTKTLWFTLKSSSSPPIATRRFRRFETLHPSPSVVHLQPSRASVFHWDFVCIWLLLGRWNHVAKFTLASQSEDWHQA